MAVKIARCPTCGGRRVRRVARDIVSRSQGRAVTVPRVTVEECMDCGERLYDQAASRHIDEFLVRKKLLRAA